MTTLTPSQELMKRARKAKRLPFETSAQRRKRYSHLVPKLPSIKADEQAEKARRDYIIELKRVDSMRYEHAKVLAHLAQRLSITYYTDNQLDAGIIYNVFTSFNWQCPVTGVQHSKDTPLTLEFIYALHQGGRIVASNLRPRYIRGLLAGEWTIVRADMPLMGA